MTYKQRILLKWTAVVVLCGAHSFFWGLNSNGSVAGMLAGMATLVAVFYRIETHPRFQHARNASAALHKALQWGLRIRIALAIFILAFYGCSVALQHSTMRIDTSYLAFPASGEMYIGAVAINVTEKMLGLSLSPDRADISDRSPAPGKSIFATYMATLITSAIHSVILALLMLLCFAYFKIRHKSLRTE